MTEPDVIVCFNYPILVNQNMFVLAPYSRGWLTHILAPQIYLAAFRDMHDNCNKQQYWPKI